jgi:uncharacterized damage-inducible protein DinB
MHSHLVDVLSRLDDSRIALKDAVDGVPEALRRTRPAPGRWSVAEVLEHLARVDRFFAERIAGALAEARAAGLGPERGAREPLPDDVVQKMQDRTTRREAREAVMPTGAVDTVAAWDDLDRARQEVRSAVATGDGLALGDVKAEHRFFGSLNVYQWVELTAAHEIRHADQIQEIGAALRR